MNCDYSLIPGLRRNAREETVNSAEVVNDDKLLTIHFYRE